MPVGPTILLVEDNENDRLLMRAALEQAGIVHSLQVARDGDEAVYYLAGHGEFSDRNRYPMPLLVLLDLSMPKKDGFAVLNWITQQPEPATYSVVVLSASNASEDVVRAYDLGARSFLVKPTTLPELVELVVPLQRYLRSPVMDIASHTTSSERRNAPNGSQCSPASPG